MQKYTPFKKIIILKSFGIRNVKRKGCQLMIKESINQENITSLNKFEQIFKCIEKNEKQTRIQLQLKISTCRFQKSFLSNELSGAKIRQKIQ